MSNRLRIHLQFGIDYGPKPPRSACAARETSCGDDHGCYLESPDDSDHLVLYAKASQVALTKVGDLLRTVTPVPPSVPVAHVDALRAFCDQHGCPWVDPQWFITTEFG